MSPLGLNPENFLPKRHMLALDVCSVRALVFDPNYEAILICQREKTGEWELPGGKPDRRESSIAAAIREVQEETGIVMRSMMDAVIYQQRQFRGDDGVHRNYMGQITIGRMVKGPGRPIPQPGEVSVAEWLSLNDAPRIIGGREDMRFRMGTAASLQVLAPHIQSLLGILPSERIKRLEGAIAGHETAVYSTGMKVA